MQVYLLGHAPKGEWQYLSHEMTDTPTLDLVENIVREKLFKYLEKEIPYVITQVSSHTYTFHSLNNCLYLESNLRMSRISKNFDLLFDL